MNYGIVYGIGAMRLANELKIKMPEAQAFINNYFQTYAGVKAYFDQTIQEVTKKGDVTTLMGRRRYVPEINANNRNTREFGKRIAINTPVQGSSADLEKYEKKGLFRIMYHDPFETDVSSALVNQIEYIKAKRLVVDSLSMLGLYMKDQASVRKQLGKLVRSVKNAGCTSIVTSEVMENTKSLSRFGVEEFVCDGVFVLNYIGIGESSARTLIVRKMRRTPHGTDIYPLELGPNGIEIKPVE